MDKFIIRTARSSFLNSDGETKIVVIGTYHDLDEANFQHFFWHFQNNENIENFDAEIEDVLTPYPSRLIPIHDLCEKYKWTLIGEVDA